MGILLFDERAAKSSDNATTTFALDNKKPPQCKSIAGAEFDESGRLDLNQRPPAPEAGQYTNQLQHSAGL
jgi:hypothetical protein